MTVSFRPVHRLRTRGGLAALLAGLSVLVLVADLAPAWAQVAGGSAVETHLDEAAPPGLPPGMEWNKPLKAGDLVLSRPSAKTKNAADAAPLTPPRLPVGSLKAPTLAPSTPARSAGASSGSVNLMLMQGMKNALSQAGQNPDLPRALPKMPEAPRAAAPISAPVSVSTSAPVAVAAPPSLPPAAPSALAEAPAQAPVMFEPGREPRDLLPPQERSAPLAAAATQTPAFAPAPIVPDSDIPKATELARPPVPLEQMVETQTSALAAPPSAPKSEPVTKAAPRRSVFGAPVGAPPKVEPPPAPREEPRLAAAERSVVFPPAPPEEKTPPLSAPPAPKSATKACVPSVVSWTKSCGEAGYPPDFAGRIAGETRVECPAGDSHDVWLTNDCAPAADVSRAIETPKPVVEKPTIEKLIAEKTPVETATERSFFERYAASSPAKEPDKGLEALARRNTTLERPKRQDAVCGGANGLAAEEKPLANLCALGDASDVAGEGPWRWSCKGLQGGMTVSCAAPVATAGAAPRKAASDSVLSAAESASVPRVAEDGACGDAHNQGASVAPDKDLCVKGAASRVNGGGPWTWACSGVNGGQAAACMAPRVVEGRCGSAGKEGSGELPRRNLCETGYASAVTGDGPWHWTCSGLHGGEAATCSATAKINAVCGGASLKGHRETPAEDLCRAGEAGSVSGDGPWIWTCAGLQGGASVNCKAPVVVDATCGAAHGQSFSAAPSDNLCAHGQPGRVGGDGPWTWNCGGEHGGDSASCAALLKVEAPASAGTSSTLTCGAASETMALRAPTENLCASGTASVVSGEGPWRWSCSDDSNHTVSCSTLAAVEGACGKAANVVSANAPKADLCASGTPGTVTANDKASAWAWACQGSLGASTVACSAPRAPAEASATPASPPTAKADAAKPAVCGSAHGRGTASAPAADLCAAGKPGPIKGRGPWTWVCAVKGGAKASCEAPLRADGVCGPVNGSIQKRAPASGLCAKGTPTKIDGEGPWSWSCVGTGGGDSVSCSATSEALARVDGACGAAINSGQTTAPDANLCDAGRASDVHGEGPWTWTCSGFNGGLAATCSTVRVVPKAPPPPGPSVNGNCGPANGVAMVRTPSEGLCTSGTATSVSGNGPWNWNCLGANGGMTVSCTAPLLPPAPISGVCGAANGVTTLAPPRSALCASGIASPVSGSGPWTWSCSGTNGGGAVGCVAPLAGRTDAALPSQVTPSSAAVRMMDEAPAPAPAPVGLVTPRLPAGPLPPLERGAVPQLKKSKDAVTATPTPPPTTWAEIMTPPSATPGLPAGSEGITPPTGLKTVLASPEASASVDTPLPDGTGKIRPEGRVELAPELTVITFAHGSDALDAKAVGVLGGLATFLRNHTLARVTLTAYADNQGMSVREARRLSLNRALAARDYLAEKGIPTGRVDVRALGANVPSGEMDRIDVKLN